MIDCVHEAGVELRCPHQARPLVPALCSPRVPTAALTCNCSDCVANDGREAFKLSSSDTE